MFQGVWEMLVCVAVFVILFFAGKKHSDKIADSGIENAKAWKKSWAKFKKGVNESKEEATEEMEG